MRRTYFVPEVIQTSAMDCGPACLAALLRGLGVPASYPRLREACRVGIDGTSIGTIEDLLVEAGFDAAQVLLPVDHVLRPEADTLPAVLVVTLADGSAHFVVAWRRLGDWVQVMDPSSGRSWLHVDALADQLVRHTATVPVDEWRAWAATDDFLRPFHAALAAVGFGPAASTEPATLSTLEAAAATTGRLVRAGVVGRAQAPVVAAAVAEAEDLPRMVAPAGDGELAYTGAVLVRVRGRLGPPGERFAGLSEAAPVRPWRRMVELVRVDLHPAPLAAATLAVATLGVVEALVLRALVPLWGDLARPGDHLVLLGCVVGIVLAGMYAEGRRVEALLALGRALDTRFRVALFEKLPRIADPYFASRPASDMVERAAAVRVLHDVPRLVGELVLRGATLVGTALALCLLDPWTAPLTLLVAALAVAAPAFVLPLLREREQRARAHNGAGLRFHLDAQVGLLPVRAQGGEASLTAAHEGLLAEWARAAGELARAGVVVEAVVGTAGSLGAIVLVAVAALRADDAPTLLLQLWWALSLPALGEALVGTARRLPEAEAVAGRLLEPLAAREEGDARADWSRVDLRGGGSVARGAFAFTLRGVSVQAGGHLLLDTLDLEVRAGEHVAIVGRSGAGKSTLLALLLGLHAPSAGELRIDGRPYDRSLRRQIVWVDPAAQLWDRSLLENLRYATEADDTPWAAVLADAELLDVIGGLPDGLGERLGPGGARLSGGQGQRVRLGRALAGDAPGLVLLDEPFRGLDRAARSRLLDRVRARHADTTLLCVTHDVRDTRRFPRVLVIEDGHLVEDGDPAELLGRDSRYAAMLAEADRVDEDVWGEGAWLRVRVENGGAHA